MRRHIALPLSTLVLLAACGGSSSSGPAPTLSLSPALAYVQAASKPVTLTAVASNASDPVSWSLSPAVGTLSAEAGNTVQFVPPATVDEETSVTVTATAGGLTAQAQIVVTPFSALTIDPANAEAVEGGAALPLVATLDGSSAPITWSLSPEVGTLSAASGGTVDYTPPAALDETATVVVSATAGGARAYAVITVRALPATLTVSPESATVAGSGAPVALSASLENMAGTVLWSLSPSVGTLSGTFGPSVSYTPPADVEAQTTVTVFAFVDDQRAQAVITVNPAPKLSVNPVSADLTPVSPALPITATLLHSTEPISWTLSQGSPGSLSAQTGATVLYTPPAILAMPTTVVVTASAAGLTAQATLNLGPALGDDSPPLPNDRFVPFSRVVEYMVLGTSNDGTQNNQFVVDPYQAFGMIDDQPISLPAGVTAPNHALLHRSTNADLMAANRKVARAGNLDDDFVDEAVVLAWKPAPMGGAVPTDTQPVAKLSILDASLPADDLTADPTITTVVPTGIDLTVEANQNVTDYDMALADVDADGYDEIIVVGTIIWDSANAVHNGKLWVFDDLEHGCAPLRQLVLTGDYDTSYRGLLKAKVVAGSMKDDRSVQIVVAWYDKAASYYAWTHHYPTSNNGLLFLGVGAFSYAIYNGADLTQIGSNHKTATLQTMQHAYFSNPDIFNVALADVDGDLKKELAFAAWNSGWWHTESVPNSSIVANIFDDLDAVDSNGNPVQLVYSARPAEDVGLSGAQLSSFPETFLVPIDNNADHVEELLVGPYPAHFVKAAGSTPASISWDTGLMPVDKWTYHSTVADLQAGDVNGDLREDFIVLFKGGQVKSWGYRDRLVSVSGSPLHKNYAANPDYVLLDTSGVNGTSNENAVLVPVNVDNDSTMLEYAGQPSRTSLKGAGETLVAHDLVYGDNKIIALLAAPPVTTGLGQSDGNSSTEFGTMVGGSFGQGTEFATRAGVLFGAEFEISTGLIVNTTAFSFELEIQNQLEYTHTNSWSHSVSQQVSDGAGDGNDLVIFSATPYDRYTYYVASNPNPSLVGTTITVDVPQTTQVMAVSRETYNSTYSNGLLITEDLLQDTPYDLASYPTRAQVPTSRTFSMVDVGHGINMASAIVPFGQMGPYNIQEGENNFKSCELSLGNDQAWQDGLTFSLDVSAKVVVGGVSAGASWGFSSGGYLERSTSNGIVFSSTVYGLPQNQFTAANKYSWGMYAYKQTLRDDQARIAQDFFVVNYWTGAYGAQ